MHVMPIAIFHVMPSLWHVMHYLHVNTYFNLRVPYINTQRQWVCPFWCAFVVRCAIVVRCPIVCFKGALSKKSMIPYCCAAVGMWIVYHFSPILVLSRACGFSQTAQAITTFATAPHCFFRTIEWKGYCIFLKCYALKALFAMDIMIASCLS